MAGSIRQPASPSGYGLNVELTTPYFSINQCYTNEFFAKSSTRILTRGRARRLLTCADWGPLLRAAFPIFDKDEERMIARARWIKIKFLSSYGEFGFILNSNPEAVKEER
jgi:hypothetical protein